MDSSAPNLESLIARIEKLESQNRRWKRAAVIVAISSAALVLAGAKLADRIDPQVLRVRTVEAQDFVLKDEDGRVHAQLSMTPNRIELNGQIIEFGPATTGPALQFYGENGKPIWTAPQRPTLIPATR